jgi:hypothetical protein
VKFFDLKFAASGVLDMLRKLGIEAPWAVDDGHMNPLISPHPSGIVFKKMPGPANRGVGVLFAFADTCPR